MKQFSEAVAELGHSAEMAVAEAEARRLAGIVLLNMSRVHAIKESQARHYAMALALAAGAILGELCAEAGTPEMVPGGMRAAARFMAIGAERA